MCNKLFRLTADSRQTELIFCNNISYMIYNRYLLSNYGTNVMENEDFIPMDTGKEIILILDLPPDGEEVEDEDVFEVMQDMLYNGIKIS